MASKLTSTQAGELVPRNTARKSLAIINEDTTDTVFIKKERSENTSVSSTDHDWRLGPGAALAFNSLVDGTQAIQERYTIVAAANTPRVSYFETEDIIR